jgi:FkbM family methyltransferase
VTALPSVLRRSARPLQRWLHPTAVERRIAALDLRRGDLALDCGANVGDVTELFVRRGASVHSFEPNPHAFRVLAERFVRVPNVTVHEQAVLDHAGVVRLYLHVDSKSDPVGASVGSSLLDFKGNVDADSFVDVEAVDLAELILGLDRPVKVVKLDIEGVECPVVNRLLDTGAIDRVGTVLVELHDRHIPELRTDYEHLRERLRRDGLTEKVHTDWM